MKIQIRSVLLSTLLVSASASASCIISFERYQQRQQQQGQNQGCIDTRSPLDSVVDHSIRLETSSLDACLSAYLSGVGSVYSSHSATPYTSKVTLAFDYKGFTLTSEDVIPSGQQGRQKHQQQLQMRQQALSGQPQQQPQSAQY